MMQLITPDLYDEFAPEFKEMHELRCRVFKARLDWEVHTEDELETDAFDELKPVYLLLKGSDWRIRGCVRLLPSAGPTMLRDTFPMLLGADSVPSTADIWESSRFAVDVPPSAPKAAGGLAQATYELFAGMIEFGLAHDLTRIVTLLGPNISNSSSCRSRSHSCSKRPFGKSENWDFGGGWFVIQAVDVDRTEPWPDGQDRQEDQALP
ncbi:acyl-homoserine-lactone synthase, partial [Mesorhizobium waimense]|uniref:acyl-homoserine-lactone synthase n=1 Tax=Mesorhizobium waimense TaxID=1300307 RepID=UPI001FE196C4